MKKIFIMICLCVLYFSQAYAELPKDKVEFLSDESMWIYESVILYSILSNMDFLTYTKPSNLEKHLTDLKYITDDPMENLTVEQSLEDMSPKQTYEQNGGDCEDLTIYTIARFMQADSYDIGFMLLRNPRTQHEQSSQHMVAVLLTDNNEIIVYDLTLEKGMKRLPLDSYLKYWAMMAPQFDAYRIHWFFCPAKLQEKAESIKR